MKNVLEEIFNSVTEGGKISEEILNKDLKGNTFNGKYILFLSLSDDRSLAHIIRGQGSNYREALQSALAEYNEQKPSDFKPTSLKLDILDEVSAVNKDFNILSEQIKYNRGLDGLAFGDSFETAFLPSEVADYSIIRKNKISINNAFKALKNHLPSTFSHFTKPLDSSKLVSLYKFKTKTYFINKDGVYELFRGHRIFSDLSKEDLWKSIELAKDNYFKQVVQKSGKFIYSFLPHRNKREKKYNMLRHAGTTYSMVETYELMPDKKLLGEINRAFTYLLKHIKPLKVNGNEVKVVVEKNAQKVGGNALTIVALAKYTQVTGDQQYVPLMQSLATWFKEIQGENGEFTVHKQNYSTGKVSDFISHYYPGEAILALVRLYQVDKNEKWLDIAEKAAQYLINIRDKSATVDTIAHDHWLLYALNDLYRERQNDIYLNHSFFIAEAMMKTQISEQGATRKELIGGYTPKSGNEPSSTPVACRSEGLSATHNLAKDFGHEEMAKKTQFAIQQGIKFQLQMQLRSETVMHYKRKKLCLGAVQGGLKSLNLRNDFTQHNLSSFIAFYKILDQKQ